MVAHTQLILAPRRQRQADHCGLEASLVYIEGSRTARLHRKTLNIYIKKSINQTNKKEVWIVTQQ